MKDLSVRQLPRNLAVVACGGLGCTDNGTAEEVAEILLQVLERAGKRDRAA